MLYFFLAKFVRSDYVRSINNCIFHPSITSLSLVSQESHASWFWSKFTAETNAKMAALNRVEDGTAFTEKSSVERKLINSLCYDFSRAFPLDYLEIDPLAKKRFFRLLWDQMPNLRPFEKLSVPHKNRKWRSLKAACFDNVSSNITNFKRLRDRRLNSNNDN